MSCEHVAPELYEDGGMLRLRMRYCAACDESRDLGVLPEPFGAAARRALANAGAGNRILDPAVIAAVAPFIDEAYPAYSSAASRSAIRHPVAAAHVVLPVGWRFEQWLRGTLGYGQARCVRDDGVRALATFTRRQRESYAVLVDRHLLRAPGVAPLVEISGDAIMFEREPAGVPLVAPMFPWAVEQALPAFAQLVAIVQAAAAAGQVLGGLRPETVYIARDAITGVAPRAEQFARGMLEERVAAAPIYPFDAPYEPREVVAGEPPTSAGDVFSACATIGFAMLRRSPFNGDGMLDQLLAIATGDFALPPGLPDEVATAMRAGLAPLASDRPRPDELAAVLWRAGAVAAAPSFIGS